MELFRCEELAQGDSPIVVPNLQTYHSDLALFKTVSVKTRRVRSTIRIVNTLEHLYRQTHLCVHMGNSLIVINVHAVRFIGCANRRPGQDLTKPLLWRRGR